MTLVLIVALACAALAVCGAAIALYRLVVLQRVLRYCDEIKDDYARRLR